MAGPNVDGIEQFEKFAWKDGSLGIWDCGVQGRDETGHPATWITGEWACVGAFFLCPSFRRSDHRESVEGRPHFVLQKGIHASAAKNVRNDGVASGRSAHTGRKRRRGPILKL